MKFKYFTVGETHDMSRLSQDILKGEYVGYEDELCFVEGIDYPVSGSLRYDGQKLILEINQHYLLEDGTPDPTEWELIRTVDVPEDAIENISRFIGGKLINFAHTLNIRNEGV